MDNTLWTILAWAGLVGLVFLAAWVLGKACAHMDKGWDDGEGEDEGTGR